MLSNVLRCHVPARLYGTASPIFQHCASAALIHEWIPPSRKHFSTSRPVAAGAEYLCQQLEHRSVIRVAGRDASPFLQGIVTNNMQCLDGTLVKCVISSLYSMMLNAQVTITMHARCLQIEQCVSFRLIACFIDHVDMCP